LCGLEVSFIYLKYLENGTRFAALEHTIEKKIVHLKKIILSFRKLFKILHLLQAYRSFNLCPFIVFMALKKKCIQKGKRRRKDFTLCKHMILLPSNPRVSEKNSFE
jgi:hypothetical protein